MLNYRRFNRLVITVLILLVGLGFALAMPLLANSQSLAAQSEVSASGVSSARLRYENLIGNPDVENHNHTPTLPSTCFAAINNGLDEFESADASAVQAAVDAADPGQVVKLAGTCTGVEARGGLLQTVYISKNLILEGGHIKSDWSLAPDPDTYTTTLDANQGGRVVVVSGTVEVTLDGLFLTRGHADVGGGILSNSSLTLRNSIIFSNTASNGGGILNNSNSTPVLANVTFSDNEAYSYGGGMYNLYINPSTMKDVKFIINKAKHGGGIFAVGSDPTLINITFSGNYASERGGGFTNSNSSPVIINSLFSGNKAGEYGGGFYDSAGKSSLINVTFSGNSAALLGGGMVNAGSGTHVSNGIFWNNQDSTGIGTYTATIVNDGGTVTLTHSLVQDSGGSGSWALDSSYVDGDGNIDSNPKFFTPVDPNSAPTSAGNLRLKNSSPAVDAGRNNAVTVSTDLDGEPRIVDGDKDGTPTVDMGAYEYQIPYLFDGFLPLILR